MRIDFSEALVSQECISCGITFAVTATVEKQLRDSQRSFQCPNGHAQSYRGVLEIERLKKRIEDLESDIADRIRRHGELWESVESRDRTIASLRGVITKLKAHR